MEGLTFGIELHDVQVLGWVGSHEKERPVVGHEFAAEHLHLGG